MNTTLSSYKKSLISRKLLKFAVIPVSTAAKKVQFVASLKEARSELKNFSHYDKPVIYSLKESSGRVAIIDMRDGGDIILQAENKERLMSLPESVRPSNLPYQVYYELTKRNAGL